MTDSFENLYRYVRLSHYQRLFGSIRERVGSLNATEAFSAEIIYLLGEPTLSEFAEFIGISQPNASYKANSLVSKGYITKTSGENDRRECRLIVTDKFKEYYGVQEPEFVELTEDLTVDELLLLDKISEKATVKISRLLDEAEGKENQ